MNIGIIGTAGRGANEHKLDTNIFDRMVEVVSKVKTLESATLISGGAAWADHVAVVTFLLKRCKGLVIHMPCEWNAAKSEFTDSGERDWRTNPGGTSNHYHRQFSRKLCTNAELSLNQIHLAIRQGANATAGAGFFERNTEIAKESDAIIAFTFGNGARIADGGTRDTFKKFKKLKPNAMAMHFNLTEMRMYHGE